MPTQPMTVSISQDGDQFCALLGENLQDGTAGFGDTISDALHQLAFKLEYQKPEAAPVAKLSVDNELLEKVTRYLAIKPHVKECEELHKLIKTTTQGEPLVELGPYDITGAWVHKKPYTPKPVKAMIYWLISIKPNPARVALVKR